jgi:integrase
VTGSDLEAIPAVSTSDIQLTGRAAEVLKRIAGGDIQDPDQRRASGAAKYHRERLAEATRRAYVRWIFQWLYFCSLFGRKELPATDVALEHFMVWLAQLDPKKGKNAGVMGVGLAPATMRQAIAGVRAFHVAARENFPDTTLARGIIEGHAEIRGRHPEVHDDQGVPPIKLPTLLELIRACPAGTNAGLRDRALLSVGFTIMARRSELSILDRDDLVDTGESIRVQVKRTKTNRLKGRTAYLPAWSDYPECCPVRAVRAWRDRLDELGVTSGPYFRAVDKWDHVHGTGTFAGPPASRGVRMAPETVELVIARAALAALGEGIEIPNSAALRAHSLRAGGATSAYEADADILAIARQGGWGDRSPVIFRYIREVDLDKRNPMRALGNQGAAT